MSYLLIWLLERIAGRDLARDVAGDMAESGGGTARLLGIVAVVTMRRVGEVVGRLWRERPRIGAVTADLRYAVRSLRRSPWYAGAVIGVMALALSLVITVFAVVDGVLFKPLPYPHARDLVMVEANMASRPPNPWAWGMSWSEVAAWQAAVPAARIAPFGSPGEMYIDDGSAVNVVNVGAGFFDVLGQYPRIGGFRERDFSAPAPVRPLVISDALWRTRFGADPSIVGRTSTTFSGASFEIVGVLPPDFLFPEPDARFTPDVLMAARAPQDPALSRNRSFSVIARLPPGMRVDDVRGRYQEATSALRARYLGAPGESSLGPNEIVRLHSLDDNIRARSKPVFMLVFATAVVLLLLACLNVTGLAAARMQDRQREVALRRALGGSVGALVRLLGAESLVVVGAGVAIGITMALGLLRVSAALLPSSLLLLRPLAVDLRVAVFAAAAFAVCVACTAAWPLARALGRPARPLLADAAGTTERVRTLPRMSLVGAQVAIALVMSIVGALLMSSLVRVWREDPGYAVNSVNLTLEGRRLGDWTVIERLIADLQHAPNVANAGGTSKTLFDKLIYANPFAQPGSSVRRPEIEAIGVTSGFREAAGLRVTAGRWPSDAELASAARVVAVSAAAAERYWPGDAAIGKTLTRGTDSYQVIGVVSEARFVALDRESNGNIYYPLSVSDRPQLSTVLVRLRRDEPGAAAALAGLVSAAYPMYRVTKADTVATGLADSIRNRKFQVALFVTFSIAGIAIAAIGVLALVAIATARRTREVGVRIALGARPVEIARLVMRQELAGVVGGLLAGGLASLWLVRLMRSYMYKMSVYDPSMWAAAAALLFAVGTIGALVPALRASRIDPVKALRED